jgi:hypothetical protein
LDALCTTDCGKERKKKIGKLIKFSIVTRTVIELAGTSYINALTRSCFRRDWKFYKSVFDILFLSNIFKFAVQL